MATHRLRFPRPKTFLGLTSLATGAELIALALVFNKATGVYGILTLVTGYALSPLQLSQYIFSVLTLVALGWLIPHIRKPSPLENLALAWIYAIDTLVSVAYTAAFAAGWFQANFYQSAAPSSSADDTKGASDAEANGRAGMTDNVASLAMVVALMMLRVYFCLVVMAHARMVVREFADEQLAARAEEGDVDGSADRTPNPFALGAPLGSGWRGSLGRSLVAVGKGFWLGGRKEDEEWARDVSSKFRGAGGRS